MAIALMLVPAVIGQDKKAAPKSTTAPTQAATQAPTDNPFTYHYTSTSTCNYFDNDEAHCCGNSTNIVIDASVESIFDYAFYHCANISTVSFSAATVLKTIGNSAFRSMTSLTGADMSSVSNLKVVGTSSFRDSTALRGLALPSSIVVIGSEAFQGTALENTSQVEWNGLDCYRFQSWDPITSPFSFWLQSCGASETKADGTTNEKYAERKKNSDGTKNVEYRKIRSRSNDPVVALGLENTDLLTQIQKVTQKINKMKLKKPRRSAEVTKLASARALQKTRRAELAALKLELRRLELRRRLDAVDPGGAAVTAVAAVRESNAAELQSAQNALKLKLAALQLELRQLEHIQAMERVGSGAWHVHPRSAVAPLFLLIIIATAARLLV
jgi:hypothetical protein